MLDHSGQPMTAASAAAVDAYEGFLDAYGRFSPTVPDALKATLEADPEMPLAWCARGALMMLSGKGELRPVAENTYMPLHPNPYVVGRPLGRGDVFVGRK
ncbi:MAG: hypothetical protein ACO2YV_09895, partial [Pseudomonadales bacterium]